MKTIKILTLLFLFSNYNIKLYSQSNTSIDKQRGRAKFEPADGECLFFIGQDLKAIGGLNNYTDGYCDNFDFPAGFTTYTNFSPGSESFGYIQKGNDGIKSIANWGAEDNCAQCILDDIDYKNCLIAIGLSIVNNEKAIASGRRDYLIRELAQWIKETKRPVFLRIGYEFDGWKWNHYNKKQYLKAWKHIYSIFKEMEVNNVAFVWQSKGNGSNQDILEKWYPGDDLVDWCGYSYFSNPDEEMLTFARKHKKPVFIAEATPVLQNDTEFLDTQLTNPKIAIQAWEEWFIPFIKTLDNNKDVIKAFSYINVNWSIQPMWINNPVFQKVDSRIQKSEYRSKRWKEEMDNPRYLKLSSELSNSIDDNKK
jgi:Glycosyl hydrolase family 26